MKEFIFAKKEEKLLRIVQELDKRGIKKQPLGFWEVGSEMHLQTDDSWTEKEKEQLKNIVVAIFPDKKFLKDI